MKKIHILLLIALSSFKLSAQTYEAKVSKDSVNILNNRIEVLKASIKIHELKIEESDEETQVEKLRIKLLEANNEAKESSEKYSKFSNKTSGESSLNLKEIQKLAKKSQTATDDAAKALDRFHKQIAKVEEIRTKITAEERKLGYKKPNLQFIK